jgi:hypothetical protein
MLSFSTLPVLPVPGFREPALFLVTPFQVDLGAPSTSEAETLLRVRAKVVRPAAATFHRPLSARTRTRGYLR